MVGILKAGGQRFPWVGCTSQLWEEAAVVAYETAGAGLEALPMPALELQHHPCVRVEGGDS